MKCSSLLIVLLLGITQVALPQSQQASETVDPDPKVAFLKSLAVPGWGHHYVDRTDWTRGQYHLAAEVMLILSYAGLRIHTHNLRNNWYSFTRINAGVDIEDRGRSFRLAVGNFDNLREYNEFQERNRNWDQFYDDVTANRWNWDSRADRFRYNDLRKRINTIEQQMPALLAMMVVNRVISGISAYNRARAEREQEERLGFYLSNGRGTGAVLANLKVSF